MKYKNSLKPSNGFRWPEICFLAIVMSFALLSIHFKVKKSSIEQKFHKGYFVFFLRTLHFSINIPMPCLSWAEFPVFLAGCPSPKKIPLNYQETVNSIR